MPAHLPRLLVTALVAALVLSGGPPAVPAELIGEPQLLSPGEGGDHFGPDIATDDAGAALVVWQTMGAPPEGNDIFARRIGPDGTPLGQAFRVNAAAAGEQRRPAVAALAGGGFVVAWDTNTSTVWARRLGPDGAPIDAEDLPVSPADDDSHFDSDVAPLPDGGFAVTWEHESLAGVGVLLRRFGPGGLAAGPAEEPYDPATTPADRLNPALAAGPDGALALVWEEATPGGVSAVALSSYDAAGQAVALAVPVAAAAAGELRDPALAIGADGVASVAWAHLPGGDPAATRVELRRLDAAGAPLGPAVTLSAPAPAARAAPAVAAGAWGITVAWADQSTRQGGAPVGLAARAISPEGTPNSDELYPRLPAVGGAVSVISAAASPAGAWVVWSQDAITEGAEGGAVYARRLAEAPDEIPGDRVLLPMVSRP